MSMAMKLQHILRVLEGPLQGERHVYAQGRPKKALLSPLAGLEALCQQEIKAKLSCKLSAIVLKICSNTCRTPHPRLEDTLVIHSQLLTQLPR